MDEQLATRVTRLEEQMVDIRSRLKDQSMVLVRLDQRQWWVLMAMFANLAAVGGAIAAVITKH